MEIPDDVNYKSKCLIKCNNCGHERNIKIRALADIEVNKRICLRCWNTPKGEAGCKQLFTGYEQSASNRKLKFEIDFDLFRKLTSSECMYCGSSPTNIRKATGRWGDYQYNGIDRIDNNKGYTAENCTPCCCICNRAKSDMTHKDFKQYIDMLVEFQKGLK